MKTYISQTVRSEVVMVNSAGTRVTVTRVEIPNISSLLPHFHTNATKPTVSVQTARVQERLIKLLFLTFSHL